MAIKIFLSGFLWFVHAIPLAGQDVSELDEFLTMSLSDLLKVPVVTASRRSQELIEAPSAISIITREEILRSPSNTIPELLQYVVGMDGYTKTHTDHDVAARGFAYDETPKMLVLINNQPVNVVPYGGVQWPTLPVGKEDIDRIEIVRGPSSALYGADAQVGVINIITLDAGNRRNSASVVYGDRGTRVYEVRAAHEIRENLNLWLSGGFHRTERKGDEETPEASLAAPNFDIKDWADIYRFGYRLDYRSRGTTFTSEGGYTTDEEGYNASAGDASIDLSEKRTLYLNNQLKISTGAGEIGVRAGFRNLWQRNKRWSGSSYIFKYELPKGRGLDVDLQYILRPVWNHSIVLGSNISRFRASRDIANDPPYFYDNSDNLWSVYAQDQISLANRRFLLTLSARYDKWDSFDGEFTPRAVANVDLYDKRVNLRLLAATSFRRPSFDENYYFVRFPGGWLKGSLVSAQTEDGSLIEGVTSKPERLTAYEAGLRFLSGENFYVDIEVFRNEVRNNLGLVVHFASEDGLNLGIANIGDRTVVKGLEIEVKTDLSRRSKAFLNYTYQTATLETLSAPEQDWTGAPKHKFSGGVSFVSALIADLRFRYVSAVTYQEVQSTPVEDYWTVDAALSKEIANRLRLKLSILNIFDRKRYEYPIYTRITRKALLTVQYYLPR